MRAARFAIIAVGLSVAAPAIAANDIVTAANPGGIVTVLRDAGHEAQLDVDDFGDPFIKTSFGDYGGSIYFYGCDETRHDRCDSIQFRAGLDRKTAMPLKLMNDLMKKYRYAAIWLDDEGDPWINFDVVTGEGIPAATFLKAYDAYSDGMATLAEAVFEEERGKK